MNQTYRKALYTYILFNFHNSVGRLPLSFIYFFQMKKQMYGG